LSRLNSSCSLRASVAEGQEQVCRRTASPDNSFPIGLLRIRPYVRRWTNGNGGCQQDSVAIVERVTVHGREVIRNFSVGRRGDGVFEGQREEGATRDGKIVRVIGKLD